MLPVAAVAAAPAISAGTIAAISALSALASAGGAGMAGYFQGQSQDRQLALEKKKQLQDQQNREEDLRINASRYDDTMAANHRQEVSQRPMESINLLSGLSNLRQGYSRPTGLDALGYLAGR